MKNKQINKPLFLKLNMDKQEIQNYRKAGEIAKKAVEYAKTIIKPGVKLVEIAEKLEEKIIELGGEIAFPVNLSIDDTAAHYTPISEDTKKAEGLLKVDLGVSIEGFIADTAFSIDLTEKNQYKELIKASEDALKSAIDLIKKDKDKTRLNEIGSEIQKSITKVDEKLSPIRNLSGHGLGQYLLHARVTIPNCNNNNPNTINEGAVAIEPFTTYGAGIVYEGGESNIYHITGEGQVRDKTARQILEYIGDKKKLLPFSQREIEKKFPGKSRLALRQLEQANIISEFPQLIEKSHLPVSQAETSLIIYDSKVEVLC